MIEVLQQTFATAAQSLRSGSTLFVSTTLDTWTTGQPEIFAHDVQIDDIAYRRLDPDFYAWLRSRMFTAKRAFFAGYVTPETFERLRASFNRIHEWAMVHLGEATLEEALRTLHAKDYQPPVSESWDRNGAPPAVVNSSTHPQALAIVDAIREQAIALGWKHERLYAVGKPQSPLRGLASYLNSGDRIGEITREAIEIMLPSGVRQHFYNPEVEQPWIRRTVSRQDVSANCDRVYDARDRR